MLILVLYNASCRHDAPSSCRPRESSHAICITSLATLQMLATLSAPIHWPGVHSGPGDLFSKGIYSDKYFALVSTQSATCRSSYASLASIPRSSGWGHTILGLEYSSRSTTLCMSLAKAWQDIHTSRLQRCSLPTRSRWTLHLFAGDPASNTMRCVCIFCVPIYDT